MSLVRFRFFVMFMVLAGCAHVRPVIEHTDTVTMWEVTRDTTLIVESDTALLFAWFKCDSTNRVIMNDLEFVKGQKVQQLVKWKNNYLTVAAVVDSEQVYFSWKEKHIKETVTEKPPVASIVQEVKKPPWWKREGYIVAFILIVYTIILLVLAKILK